MPTIGGKPDIPAGYFYHTDDKTKGATAQRATFNPGVNNRIVNRFARMGLPKVAGFVNSIRNMDLSIRQSVNKRKLDNARSKYEKLGEHENVDVDRLQKIAVQKNRYEIKDSRLDNKRLVGDAAVAGNLQDGVGKRNQAMADVLQAKGYQKLDGLRDAPQGRRTSDYLSALDDRHRIKINSERPPMLARIVANSVSSDYDNGTSGAARTARSTVQHALVGIQGAALSIKGSVARGLAEKKWLDEGARGRMEVRAARATQKKSMLQASFQGNAALHRAFERSVEEQVAAAEARFGNAAGPAYAVKEKVDGVKPLQTRFWERKVNAYYARPPENDDGQDPAQGRKAGRMARFVIGIGNIGPRAALAYHSAKASDISVKISSADSQQGHDALGARLNRHAAAMDKQAQIAINRRLMMQGRLIDTLRSEALDAMDQPDQPEQSFPEANREQAPVPAQERTTGTMDTTHTGPELDLPDDLYEVSPPGSPLLGPTLRMERDV